MKHLFYALMLALVVVVALLYVGKHKNSAPSGIVSSIFTKEIMKEAPANTADEAPAPVTSREEPKTQPGYLKVVLSIQGFVIILLLGCIVYLAGRVSRLDRVTREIKAKAKSTIHAAADASAKAPAAMTRKASDDLQNMVMGSVERVDRLVRSAETRLDKKLKEVEEVARLVLESEESTKKSRDIAELMNEYKRYYENKGYLKAVELSEKAIAIDPDYKYAHLNRGLALAELGRFDEALAAYEEAARLDPRDAQAYYLRGNALNRSGRHEDAIAAYDEAVGLDPKFAQAYNNKGVALDDLGRHEDALAAYDEAVGLDPKFAQAYNNKGAALFDLGRFDEALTAYDEAVRLDPKHAQTYYNRGNALSKIGRHDEALAAYDEAVRLDSRYGHVLHPAKRA